MNECFDDDGDYDGQPSAVYTGAVLSTTGNCSTDGSARCYASDGTEVMCTAIT